MGMFDTAKKVSAPAKAKASSKAEVAIVGIENLAMIDALEKTLETLRATIEGEVKSIALARFVQHVQDTGTRPESFRGVEGGASASLELRRKGSNIGLNDAQVSLLRQHGLEPAREVSVPKLYALNPAYAENAEILQKVEAALAGVVPPDFIVIQEERAKFTVTEEVLSEACRKKLPQEVLTTLTTLAVKPKLVKTNLASILEFVRGLIGAPAFGEAAQESKNVKLHLVKAA